ncbi:PREDICTED: trichoplein keratin filament-binding protein-like [Priapulus caudatus]|uniref:Trichoplein keratin filament-binding protein n=1 Tax=Priapulus caudatus TaxID=37621 RepID=A0ABM1E478_PRICU|nr:PREDICTED: trichoplein keratin filament-binding protein-like [Priapulus caudatus]XP_014666999.1 PREDICTED: trichoplein keratin filament-binding protein-like [Priapulus caudatus]XP_014667000.1 PREDICTED: trichoplein keratin filament-binding protein-like [Priapulus caudatus]XP_014667001.1 PREDICTED: trichoplein keratin filament-binding protein-like [Priapulus caudatus]XP_014667002.1 PREDICTED: trichoplein keratin filament-binding protein-like [Priapulus caudatus]
MALPTLSSFWAAPLVRHNVNERLLVQRREHQANQRECWDKHLGYFQRHDIITAKQNQWLSDRCYRESMEAYSDSKEPEKKAHNLAERRRKLASMLQADNDQYEVEIKAAIEMKQSNNGNANQMKTKADILRRKREEERKKIADDRQCDMWRRNSHNLRSMESEKHRDSVVQSWKGQITEKQEQLATKQQEEKVYEDELKRQVEEDEKKLRADSAKKKKEKLQIKKILEQQMRELRIKEDEAEDLRRKHERLLQDKWQLEQMEEERQELDEKRERLTFGKVLLRQHKAALRRKSKQVQEELELDRQILETLSKVDEEETERKQAMRREAEIDASWMQKVVEDQLELERQREEELDILYEQEAAHMWDKREAEWAKESQARKLLMCDVLLGRAEQIRERMQINQQLQQVAALRQEELVREMHESENDSRKITELEQKKKERQRALLDDQQKENEQVRRRSQLMSAKLEEAAKKREDEDAQLLQWEEDRFNASNYQPKCYRRRKMAWT